MKTLIPTIAAAILLSGAPEAFAQRFQQEAYLIVNAAKREHVWLSQADEKNLTYYDAVRAVDSRTAPRKRFKSIWLVTPKVYSEAIDLYESRDYGQARARFAEIREQYKPLKLLPNNHSSLAGLYELESLRKLGQLEELVQTLAKFDADDRKAITRKHHLSQLELYKVWEKAQQKDWKALEAQSREWLAKDDIPAYQRAQAGYCLALALEGQQKPLEAVDAYNISMTADTGASEVLTRDATLAIMRIYSDDPDAKRASKLFGTVDFDPNSPGALRLAEAASLAELFEMSLGGGQSLPAKYKALAKYLPQVVEAEAEESEPDEESDDDKKKEKKEKKKKK